MFNYMFLLWFFLFVSNEVDAKIVIFSKNSINMIKKSKKKIIAVVCVVAAGGALYYYSKKSNVTVKPMLDRVC